MGKLKNAIVGDKAKVKAHKDAKQELANNKDKTETPEFLAAHAKVLKTASSVPWHRR